MALLPVMKLPPVAPSELSDETREMLYENQHRDTTVYGTKLTFKMDCGVTFHLFFKNAGLKLRHQSIRVSTQCTLP